MKEIFHRTSVRRYTGAPVEPAQVEQMLRAAMAAPSACNQQPWEFYVTARRDTLNALSACSPYAQMLQTAPLGFVVCYRTACQVPAYAQIDCAAATENLLLMADALGLGAAGTGGDTVCLAVKINTAATHTAIAPVCINFHCWVARRAGVRIYDDGRVERLL